MLISHCLMFCLVNNKKQMCIRDRDFLTGGDDNIFGETKESCLAAIDKVLERIENPLAAVTEERAAYLQQEKEFYTVLASKIRE